MAEEPELLTPGQCADRRGVSRQSIHKAITRGEIPTTLMFGRIKGIRTADCDAYKPSEGKKRSGEASAEARRQKGAGKRGADARWNRAESEEGTP